MARGSSSEFGSGNRESSGLVQRFGRCFVSELLDSIRDPAPDGLAVVITAGRKLVGARGAFRQRRLTTARYTRVATGIVLGPPEAG